MKFHLRFQNTRSTSIRKILSIFPWFIFLFLLQNLSGQATWYSYQSGNWETASSWTTDPSGTLYINPTSLTPSGTDVVVVMNGRTIVKTTSPGAATPLCNTLEVRQGAIMDFRGTNNHTINTVNGQGIIKTQGVLPAVATFNFNNTGGGTIEFNNTANFNFSNAITTFNNLTLNFSTNAIIGTLVSNLTIHGNFNIQRGVFQINSATGGARTISVTGDVNVSNTGSITLGGGNYNHTFNIKGNFVNNGSVDFYELNAPDYSGTNFNTTAHADVIFNNAYADQNLVCNGYSEFYRIGIYKGSDWTYTLNIDADDSNNFKLYGQNNNTHNNDGDDNLKALGLTSGTLRLGPNIIIPCLNVSSTVGNHYSINSIAQLIIDGAEVYSSNIPTDMGVVIYGKLMINSGKFDATNTQASVITRRTSNLTINGGTFIATQLRTSNETGTHRGAFIMTGGTLNLITNTSSLSWADNSRRHATLSFTYPDNVFKMSGGTINILGSTPEIDDGGGTTGFDYSLVLGSNPSNVSVTGGTINITIPDNRPAYITSTVPFWNLNIIGTNGNRNFEIRDFNVVSTPVQVTAKPLVVYNDLTLQNNAVFQNSTSQNVFVGRNFNIQAGTSYNPGSNQTVFNGKSAQLFTNSGTIGNGGLYDMVLENSSITSLAQNLIIRRNLNISPNCTLHDMGKTISVAGNISNSGVHTSQASGGIILTNAGVQSIGGSGAGVFGNLSIQKTGGSVSLTADQSLTGNLRLGNNGNLNIGSFHLMLGPGSRIFDALNSDGQTLFGSTKMIITAGNQSDAGITKTFANTNEFIFPIGTGADYTPARIQITEIPTAWGSITVKPVAMRHLLLQGSNNSITYFWHTMEAGFVGLPANSVIHKYYYANSDIDGDEDGFMPGRYFNGAWTTGTTFDVSEDNNEILFNHISNIDGDYTCGEATAFTGPTVFYSRNLAPDILTTGADWNLTTTWSTDPVLKWDGAAAISLPTSSNVVIIGDGTVAHKVNTSVAATCGNLLIQEHSTLDLGNVTGHNFGAFPESKVGGSGKLRISSTTFPQGDWGTFLSEAGGIVEYYSTSTVGVSPLLIPAQYNLPAGGTAGIQSYNHLIVAPGPGKTINFPNTNLTVYRNLTIDQNGLNPVVQINPGATSTTVTVKGDLTIRQNSLLRFANQSQQNLTVEGNIDIETGAILDVSTSGAAYNNMLTAWGNIQNNGTLNMLPATNRYCNILFKGSNNTSLGGTTAFRTQLNAITIDKGDNRNPVMDVTVNNTNFSLNTSLANALTLTNGTFRLSNGAFITLSTGAYAIPSTGCVSVNNGTINIASDNASGNDLSLIGRIEVMGTGIMSIGTIANTIDNDIEYASGGTPEIIVNGGTLNVNGQIRRALTINTGSLNYIQRGGIVNIFGENASNARSILEVLNPGSSFVMTGGFLNIAGNFNNATYNELYLAPETNTVSGGTVRLGLSGTTPAGTQFNIVSACPLGNLIVSNVTNLTVNQRIYPLTLLGDLSVEGGSSVFCTNGLDVNIGGGLINNNTNAGLTLSVGGYQAVNANQITNFNGTSAQQITGTGTNITNFANLKVNTRSSLGLTNADIRIAADLLLNTGTLLDNSRIVTVLRNIENNSTHSSSSTSGGIYLEGTVKQVISGNGNGVFGNVRLNNSAGTDIVDNCRINGRLTFINGILYIDDYLLKLGENFTVSGNGATRYIRLNGALSDQGVRKIFGPGIPSAAFTFPIGVSGKYTPATYNITANSASTGSQITIKPVNAKHPATSESPAATNELQYYWNVTSSGFSGLNVTHTYNYNGADALPNEANYVVGYYRKSDYTWNVPTEGAVNAGSDLFTVTNVNFIDGEFTCGVNMAPSPNFVDLPVYYSRNATSGGNWNDPNAWTTSIGGGDCSGAGCVSGHVIAAPNGNPIVIYGGHTITMNIDNARAYSVDILGTFNLANTRYHSLGHISGNGTMRISANAAPNDNFLFPGGYYDVFMSTPGSIVEFYGANSGSLPLKPGNFYKPFQNVIFSGNSTKRMSSENMKVLNDLTIRNGSVLNNSFYNKNISLLGDWINENAAAGGFLAGYGLVSLDGTASQNINVVSNIVETFYDLRIQNSTGASITTGNGDVDVNRYLYLTSGNITTSATNSLTLNNTSNLAVKGGGDLSFVDGPLRKRISNNGSFYFPVGKSLPRNRFGNIDVQNTATTGIQTWTAEYFDSNPHPVYDTSRVNDPLTEVSGSEYWKIDGPASGKANVRLRWDEFSENIYSTPLLRQNLRVAEYLPAGWTSVGQLVSDFGSDSGTVETILPVDLDSHVFTLGVSSCPIVRVTSPSTVSICDDGSEATIKLLFTDAANEPFDFTYSINGGPDVYVYDVSSSYDFIFDGATLGGAGDYDIEITNVWDNTGVQGVVRSPSMVTITVLATPENDITGPDEVGTNTTTAYATSADHTDSYNWSLSNALGTVNLGTSRTPTVDWGNTAGNSTLNILKTSPDGCITNASMDITISLSPQPDIQGSASVCAGSTQVYYVTNNPGHSYLWTVSSGGSISGSSTGSSISVIWGSAANDRMVSVVETDDGTGFSGTDDLEVDIGFVPQANRTVTVLNPTICIGGSSTIRIQNSENNVAYQLRNDFDNSNVGSYIGGNNGVINFTVSPTTTTTYNILAYTSAPFGCSVELSGTYAVTVATAPATPTASVTAQPTCAVPTGTITVTSPNAAYEYAVDGGTYQSSAVFAGLLPGNHTVTARLAASPTCVSLPTANISVANVPTAPATPTASVTTQPTCAVPTGTITVTSPNAAYEYAVDGGTYQSSAVFAGLLPGNHTVTARLAASPTCVSLPTANISVANVPTAPATPTASVTAQPTCAVPTGTITVSSPNAAYEYAVDGGTYQSSAVFAGLLPGNHTVTARLAASPTCVSLPTANISVANVPTAPATPTASVSTQPTCAVPTGTITVTSPNAAYEYAVDGGTYQSSAVFAGLLPGNHTVTARLAASPTCVSLPTANISVANVPTAPATPTASVSTQPTCAVPTGTITVSSPNAAYEYAVDGGTYQSSAVFAGLLPGNHTVTARLAASPTCVSLPTANISVANVPTAPATPTASVTAQPTCAVPTGTITVTSPNAAYEYAVDGGTYQSSAVFAGLLPGNHTVTARLAASPTCVSLPTANISVANVPTAPATPTASVSTQPTCAVPTGTITVTSPNAAYEYAVDGGTYQSSAVFAGLLPGNHTVTARLAASPTCVSLPTANISVANVPTAPATPTASVTTQPTCAVPTGTITVTSPNAAYEYAVDGGTYQSSAVFAGLLPGNHTVTARLAASPTCVSLPTANISVANVPTAPATPTASVSTQPTCAVPTGTITVSSPNAAYEYAVDGGTYQSSAVFAGLLPGNHTVTARLAASPTCVSLPTANISVANVPTAPATPTASVSTQPTCAVPTGTITVSSPNAAYEYAVDGGTYQSSAVFAGLLPGNHTVTARLAASPTCVSLPTANISVANVPTAPATPTASVTAQPTCAVPTGTITVSSPNAAYEYAVDGGTYQSSAVFAGLLPGNHTVTARLAASPTCVSLPTANISVANVPTAPATPTASVSTQPTCAVPTGTITVTSPNAAYEYAVDGGTYQSSAVFAGLLPGNHTVTARLAASPTCVSLPTANISVANVPTAPATPTASVSTQPTCAVPTGTITVTSPNAAYEYAVDGGTYQSSAVFAGLLPGNHTVTARLAASPTCVSLPTANISVANVPTAPATPTASVSTQPTCAVPTGTITVSSPNAAYEYAVDGGTYQSSAVFAGLLPGNHTVTARLAASPTCVSLPTANISVANVPTAPATPTASVSTQPTCAVPTGTITVTSPNAAYEYAVDGGTYQSSAVFAGLLPGNHTVTARLAASPTCVSLPTANISVANVPTAPATPTASVTAQPTCAVPTGTITVSSPNAAYEYAVDGGTYQSSAVFAGLLPGNHTVTARLAASPTCVSLPTANISVANVPTAPATPTASVSTQPTCAVPTGTITVTSPNAAYEYAVDGGTYQSSAVFAGLLPGNHTVTARLAASPTCVSLPTANISVANVPTAPATPTASVTTQPTCAVPTGTITVTSPNAAYEYAVDGGTYQSSAVFAGLLPGNHTVTARLAASPTCVSLPTANISVANVPTAPATPTASVSTQPTCAVPTGTITVSSPNAAYEYAVDGGTYQSSAVFAGLLPGNHTVTARLAASPTCVSLPTANISVANVPTAPATPTASVSTQPTCAVPTGTITVSSPNAAYEYAVDGGTYQSSAVFAGLLPGNHTVTARLAASPTCVSLPTANISVANVPTAPATPTASVSTQPTCAVPTGTITVTSPNAAYEYAVDGGTYQSSAVFAGLLPGNHTVTARLAASPTCVSLPTANISVANVPTAPATPTASVSTQPTCAVPTGTITVSSPNAAYEYAVDGGTYQSSAVFAGLLPGNHTVTARLAASPTCVSLPTANISVANVPTAPATPPASVSTQPTCAVPTGTITVTSPNAAYEYAVDGGTYQSSAVFAGLLPGNHTVTARLAASPTCVSLPTANISVANVPTAPATPTASVTAQPTCAVPTGTITVSSPNAAYEYAVDGGTYQSSAVFAGLLPGNHTVTARLAASPTCVSLPTANISVANVPTAPATPTASVSTQPTCAVPTGTITVTSPNAAYEYAVDGGTYQSSAVFAGLLPGNHTVTARLAASPTCVSLPTANISVANVPTAPATPTASVSTQPTCAVPTGTITVSSPNAAYEYAVDGGTYQSSAVFAGLLPGNHTVTARLAASPTCVSLPTANISVANVPTAPATPTASVTTQPTCAVPTGTITVTSPNAAYEYAVDGGTYQSSAVFAGLLPGNHTVTARLAASPTCVSLPTANISVANVPTAPATPTASVSTQPTCAVPTGTITVTSPNAAYEYAVDGGTYQSSAVFAGLLPGNHTVTARLAASPTCVSLPTANISVANVPTAPATPTASVTTQPTCAVPTGTITVTSPNAAYEYAVDGGTYQSSAVFAGLLPGNHTVTARLAASPTCVSLPTANISVANVPTAPATPTASVSTQPTCAVPTGTITVSSPNAAYEYAVDGGTYQSSAVFAGLLPGNHTVTARLAASPTCVSLPTANISVANVPTAPATPTASETISPTCTVATGTITVSSPLGAVYEYAIDGGTYQSSVDFPGLLPGNHTIRARLATVPSCESDLSVNITLSDVPSVPDIPVIGAITQPTCTVATGSVVLTGLPASGTWTLTRNPDAVISTGTGAIATISGLTAGTYTFTVENEDGCISNETGDITINSASGCDLKAGFTVDDQEICLNQTVIFTDASIGASPATNYTWSFGAGANPSTASGIGPHTVQYQTAGSKTVQLIVEEGADDILTMTDYIMVHEIPAVSIPDVNRCGPGPITFESDLIGDKVEYSLDGGLTVASTDLSAPFEFVVDLDDQASVQIWAKAYNTATGCASGWDSTAYGISYQKPVAEPIQSSNTGSFPSGYVDAECSGKENALYYVNGSPLYTYSWHIPELGLDVNNNMQMEVDWNVTGGAYTIELVKTSHDGCSSLVRDTLVLVSQPDPELGNDISLCEGESHTFELDATYSNYLWQDVSTDPTFNMSVSGIVQVRVMDNYGCIGLDTVQVAVHTNPVIYLGRDTVLCEDLTLTLDAGDFEQYEWSNHEAGNPIVVGSGAGLVSVIVTDENGCKGSDEILIEECSPENLLVIPNTFTPGDDDNIHKTWVIQNLNLFPDADIQVFDRWGRRVFQSNGSSGDEWDGKGPNGKDLPVDTYYYIIDLHVKNSNLLTGTITIIR